MIWNVCCLLWALAASVVSAESWESSCGSALGHCGRPCYAERMWQISRSAFESPNFRAWFHDFGAVLYVAFQSVLLRRTVLHLELLRVPFALFGITLLMAATGAFLLDKPAAESPFSVNISQVLDGFLWLKQFVFLDVFKERHTGNRGESLSLHFSSSPHFGASHHTFVDSFEIITEILVEFCTILVVEVADFLQR